MLLKSILLLTCLHSTLASLIEDIWGTGDDESTTSAGPVVVTSRIEGTTANNTCECVVYYQCINGTHNTHGVGIIDVRITECPSYLETCCNSGDIIINPTTPTPLPKHHGCGYRNPDGVGFRINGQTDNEAEFGEFPWMVAIYEPVQNKKRVTYHCGGSLIHPQVVLTAVHCVRGKKNLKIRAGEWDTQTEHELHPYQEREVVSVIAHPQYYAGAVHNDVAILLLNQAVKLDQHINVACLPPQDLVINSTKCFSTGWGKDKFDKESLYQVILKKVELPMVPRETCQENLRKTRLGKHFELHESFVCAGGEAGKDTCKGDGGSPLVCPIEGAHNRYFQVGMVAWGIGCGESGIPGVYVNVALFRNWIDQELKNNNIDITTYQYRDGS